MLTFSRCLMPFAMVCSLLVAPVASFAFAPRAIAPMATSSTVMPLRMSGESEDEGVDLGDVGFVLLAGGTGSRMKANMPKQFLILDGVPVLHHSLDLFLNRLPEYAEAKGLR